MVHEGKCLSLDMLLGLFNFLSLESKSRHAIGIPSRGKRLCLFEEAKARRKPVKKGKKNEAKAGRMVVEDFNKRPC